MKNLFKHIDSPQKVIGWLMPAFIGFIFGRLMDHEDQRIRYLGGGLLAAMIFGIIIVAFYINWKKGNKK